MNLADYLRRMFGTNRPAEQTGSTGGSAALDTSPDEEADHEALLAEAQQLATEAGGPWPEPVSNWLQDSVRRFGCVR